RPLRSAAAGAAHHRALPVRRRGDLPGHGGGVRGPRREPPVRRHPRQGGRRPGRRHRQHAQRSADRLRLPRRGRRGRAREGTVRRPTGGALWRDAEFLKFWAGEATSQIGAQITQLALPLTAVLTLQASSSQVGLVNAASYAPFLLVTLFVGVWVDRVRRRPVM